MSGKCYFLPENKCAFPVFCSSERIEDKERIQWFAAKYANAHDVFFVGRGIDYAVCLEGSLKLKEISYIHSEAYAAGELKHGTISLIEQGTLVFSGSVDEFDNYIVPSTVEVSLIARPPVEDLRSGIPGVLQVEELGGTRYRLHFTDAQEALERVAEVSATRGWRLNELNMEKSSLDAIFAELSKK